MPSLEVHPESHDPVMDPGQPITPGSLRRFHLVFIWASAVLAVVVGLWAIREITTGGGAGAIVMAVVAFALLALLIAYGQWFLHKLERAGLH